MSERVHPTDQLWPSLTYADARAAIDWLERAFGFEPRLVVAGEGDSVMHSELAFGPSVVMVSSPKEEADRLAPTGTAASQALCVYLEDPDPHFERAVAAGAEVLREPADEPYGGRGYLVRDPGGHHWYFGSYRPGTYWGEGRVEVAHGEG